jgi:hypothetical protein
MVLPGAVFGPIVWPFMTMYGIERLKKLSYYPRIVWSDGQNQQIFDEIVCFYTTVIPRLIFCPNCQRHYAEQLKETPITQENIGSDLDLIQWVLDRHNKVASFTQKKQWTLDEIRNDYKAKCNNDKNYQSLVVYRVMELWAMEAFEIPDQPTVNEQEEIKEFFMCSIPAVDYVFSFMRFNNVYKKIVARLPPVTTSRKEFGEWYSNIMNRMMLFIDPRAKTFTFEERKKQWEIKKLRATYKDSIMSSLLPEGVKQSLLFNEPTQINNSDPDLNQEQKNKRDATLNITETIGTETIGTYTITRGKANSKRKTKTKAKTTKRLKEKNRNLSFQTSTSKDKTVISSWENLSDYIALAGFVLLIVIVGKRVIRL